MSCWGRKHRMKQKEARGNAKENQSLSGTFSMFCYITDLFGTDVFPTV